MDWDNASTESEGLDDLIPLDQLNLDEGGGDDGGDGDGGDNDGGVYLPGGREVYLQSIQEQELFGEKALLIPLLNPNDRLQAAQQTSFHFGMALDLLGRICASQPAVRTPGWRGFTNEGPVIRHPDVSFSKRTLKGGQSLC